jgi:hypothetical protein
VNGKQLERRRLDWSLIAQVSASALTISGLLLYALQFMLLRDYYSEFGLQPEEVGISYGYILSRAWPAGVAVAIATGLSVMLFSLAARANINEALAAALRVGGGLLALLPIASMFFFVAGTIATVHPTILKQGTFATKIFTDCGEEGEDFLGLITTPPVPRVYVKWIAPTKAPFDPKAEIFYFGTSDGVVSLHGFTEGTFRVPASAVAISFPCGGRSAVSS